MFCLFLKVCFLVGVWFFTVVVESYFAQRRNWWTSLTRLAIHKFAVHFTYVNIIHTYIYIYVYISSWKLGIYLSSLRRGFLKNTPKKQKKQIHYLTYPQPDPISPNKNIPKGLGRTPGHGAARTRGLNPRQTWPGRMAIFGVEGFPPKKRFQCPTKSYDISPAPACFNSSWFLVVLVTLILPW